MSPADRPGGSTSVGGRSRLAKLLAARVLGADSLATAGGMLLKDTQGVNADALSPSKIAWPRCLVNGNPRVSLPCDAFFVAQKGAVLRNSRPPAAVAIMVGLSPQSSTGAVAPLQAFTTELDSMRFPAGFCSLVILMVATALAWAGDGNRFAYLDDSDPFYVSRSFPKLVPPQWVGQQGVQAVVILAIDDLVEDKPGQHEKWEKFLRPILQRLKEIDGRAPVSIMTNRIDPRHPQLQAWLKEGLSLEVHTYDHPCPLLQKGDFAKAKATFDRCVDQMDAIAGSRAVHSLARTYKRTGSSGTRRGMGPGAFTQVVEITSGRTNFQQGADGNLQRPSV